MKIYRSILAVACVFIIVISFTLGTKYIKKDKISGENVKQQIINLWHIDTFEGGINSRADFLFKNAVSFEKKNKGLLVLVTNISTEGLIENYSKNIFPDMISFGIGVEIQGINEINTTKNYKGGNLNGKTYAVPWCKGGYVVIANPIKVNEIGKKISNAVISYNEYTQPLMALIEDDYELSDYEIKKPLDAYTDFVDGKYDYLIGTQRDIHRLERRNFEFIMKPIENYNDIYQYIAVTSKNQEFINYSVKFIETLLNENSQNNLNNIGMLSPYYSINQDTEKLRLLETENDNKTLNCLIGKVKYQELFDLSKEMIDGKINLDKNFKNVLV